MNGRSISDEIYREYDFFVGMTPDGLRCRSRVYRIEEPVTLFVGETTHRVLDAKGVVHCVPAPGFHGCVLRWRPREGCTAVSF